MTTIEVILFAWRKVDVLLVRLLWVRRLIERDLLAASLATVKIYDLLGEASLGEWTAFLESSPAPVVAEVVCGLQKRSATFEHYVRARRETNSDDYREILAAIPFFLNRN